MKKHEIKDFYKSYADEIIEKRLNSKYALRMYAHIKQYQSILDMVKPGMRVLDDGCGEGVLSLMMAKKGATVTGCDISLPNIQKSKAYAEENNVSNIKFIIGDSENLPFDDSSFDLVVSSHVLEHLPDFDKGLREAMRVTKKTSVIAIPTIINPCSWVRVGGGMFWIKGIRSFYAMFSGFLKTVIAFVLFKEGVDETYAGMGAPHVFRFPYIMKRKIKQYGFNLVWYEASSVCLPYFEFLLPLVKILDKNKRSNIIKNLGYGTTFVIEK